MSRTTSGIVDIGRTIVALVAMLGAMVLMAHLSSTLAVITGFEGLTTGAAGRVLFAVSAGTALAVVFAAYSTYYYYRS
ncbi:hypothetical protein [Haloarchaeobius sp. DYHT-AS-18]|uniref:hypothetical protein n=1 Tax=Haloarchaeobius sp. DYHT-AS-18 TaxID=3446117 RepID=UPI003EBC995C